VWPRDYTTGEARPRVIRKVVQRDRKGQAKIAYDRKIHLRMERITASTDHACAKPRCRKQNHDPADRGMIMRGDEYAMVVWPQHKKGFARQPFPISKRFHINCVPEEARPLVRFLWPDK
jgi:hypothetical protein